MDFSQTRFPLPFPLLNVLYHFIFLTLRKFEFPRFQHFSQVLSDVNSSTWRSGADSTQNRKLPAVQRRLILYPCCHGDGRSPKLSHTRLQWEDERKKEDEEEEDEKEEERKENHTTSKNQILNDCLYNAYFLHPKMAQNKQLTTPWRRLLV